ncbi:MAG: DUF4176 domain-containing protein [Clostridium sp.]|nr:DUF4176 domain-containing protein [Clostridium sp.]
MEKLDFLPLGSLVVAKGGARRKMIVIARGLALKLDGVLKFFDYGGCFYPDGMFGTRILYFNREDIEEVLHEGYSDEDDKRQIDEINKWLAEHNMERGSVAEAKEKAHEEFGKAAERAREQAASVKNFLKMPENQTDSSNEDKKG